MSTTKLWRRIWNSLAFATITQANDTGPVLVVQAKIGYLEVNDNVPVPQQFGFQSVPPLGSDVAITFVGGDRSNSLGVGTNHQATRFKDKAAGETVMFNAFGMSVYLSATGIVINTGGMPMTIDGNLNVTGTITEGFGGVDQVGVSTHHHLAGGSPTTAPVAGS